jgi:hypothetical protein
MADTNTQPTSTPVVQPVVVATPPAAAQSGATQTPSTPGELPTINFDQFESVRDTQFTTPQSPVVPVEPAVSTATPTTTPSTATPITPTTPTPAVTPPASTTTPAPTTPTSPTGLDKDGKPIVPELDLTQSAFAKDQTPIQQQQVLQPSPTNLPDVEDGRDMKGFNEDERKAFRKMSNEAFNFLAPKYREAQGLKQQIDPLKQENETLKQQVQKAGNVDPLLFANPNGFIFTPEFSQASQGEQNFNYESQFWQNQLAALKSNKKPRLLQHNGQQYLAGPEMEPDGNTEALIINNITRANMGLQQCQQLQQNIRLGWQQQVVKDLDTIKRTEDAYFPWFKEGQKHSFQPVIDSFVAQMPPTQRSNPLARALGKAYAVIQHLQSRVASTPTIAAPVSTNNQGPLGISAPAPIPAANGLPEDIMSAFDKVKQG